MHLKMTRASIAALPIPTTAECGATGYVWHHDTQQVGLWLKATPRGTRTFYYVYRDVAGIQRKVKLGRFGSLTVEQAREAFTRYTGDTAQGKDPASAKRRAREAKTVEEIADAYEQHIKDTCSPKTQDTVRRAMALVRQYLGKLTTEECSRADVIRSMDKVKKPGARLQYIRYTKAMFGFGLDRGLWPESRPLPTTRIKEDVKSTPRKRDLTDKEYARIGAAIITMYAEGWADHARLQCIEFIALTGCRPCEAINLRIEYIKGDDIEIPSSAHKVGRKTGAVKRIAITRQVADLLKRAAAIRKERKTDTWVFSRAKEIAGQWLQDTWRVVRRKAGTDARLYSFRSSYITATVEDLNLPDSQAMDLTEHKNRRVWDEHYRVARRRTVHRNAQAAADLAHDRLFGGAPPELDKVATLREVS